MRNDGFPSRARINMLRAQYPKGTRVELVHTSDPYTKLQPGTKGTVEFVDDAGTIQISWDNGSGLGMIPGEDEVRKL